MKGVLNSAFTDSYWPSDRLPGSELLQWCNCVTAGCSLTSFSTSSSPPASFCLSVLPGHKRSDTHRQKHKGLPLEDCLYVNWCMCFFYCDSPHWRLSLIWQKILERHNYSTDEQDSDPAPSQLPSHPLNHTYFQPRSLAPIQQRKKNIWWVCILCFYLA